MSTNEQKKEENPSKPNPQQPEPPKSDEKSKKLDNKPEYKGNNPGGAEYKKQNQA